MFKGLFWIWLEKSCLVDNIWNWQDVQTDDSWTLVIWCRCCSRSIIKSIQPKVREALYELFFYQDVLSGQRGRLFKTYKIWELFGLVMMIYLLWWIVCLFVCVSRKIITFHFRAEQTLQVSIHDDDVDDLYNRSCLSQKMSTLPNRTF